MLLEALNLMLASSSCTLLAAGALGEHRLHLARSRQGQHQVAALVGGRRPGNVDHAQHPFGAGQEHRRGGAGPAFDALAEVFGGVHLHWLAGCQRGADAVRADHALVPLAALDEVHVLGRFECVHVAGHLEHDAVRVGQQQDRARAREQMGRRQEQPLRGPQQILVVAAQGGQGVAAGHQRRQPGARLDAGALTALP